LEMPAGAIEPGETPAQAMASEIVEETGFVCSSLILATTCRLMLNRESAVEHFFIGMRAQSKPDARVTENIQVHILERDRLLDLIISHRFEQTVALGAIYIVQKAYDIDLLSANVDVIEARFRSEL
jgi:8-oxo-dGTP pyrophosphatase MutT (NUDIX family)